MHGGSKCIVSKFLLAPVGGAKVAPSCCEIELWAKFGVTNWALSHFQHLITEGLGLWGIWFFMNTLSYSPWARGERMHTQNISFGPLGGSEVPQETISKKVSRFSVCLFKIYKKISRHTQGNTWKHHRGTVQTEQTLEVSFGPQGGA